MPIKERRTKILLLLFLVSDIDYKYTNIDEKLQKIFDLTFNQKTKGTLSSLLKDGLIEKLEQEYRLTDKGYYSLCLEFPYFRFFKQKWDGMWRIISYEIPESKRDLRDRLRREMKGWGLGPWHRSFWLTPHPIIESLRDLIYGREEEKYVQAFESTHVFGNTENLVEKVWEKSSLEKKYKDLFKKWHEILSEEKDKNEKLAQIIYSYIEIIRNDPGLPENLVGKNWIGFEAFRIFKEIKEILMV